MKKGFLILLIVLILLAVLVMFYVNYDFPNQILSSIKDTFVPSSPTPTPELSIPQPPALPVD